uniref:Uncharacterized protein n=1 Tax=Erythrolobus australicus TaxID=1077150 RepID=A0A7S1TMG9_9RHOD|mmetsp:Transcript_4331/g.11853  ORF Transcript_4331/g.11853 Transcript_4331/m.11853 type:complete len:456 (+) Transcript_4331:140-1507(+)
MPSQLWSRSKSCGARNEQVRPHGFEFDAQCVPLDERDVTLMLRLTSGANPRTIERVINSGADPNANVYGEFPLHAAASSVALNGSSSAAKAVIELLVSRGAELNRPDAHQKRALHRAAASGHLAALRALLQAGADLEVTDADGNTPLHLAALSSQEHRAGALLVEAGANVSAQNLAGDTVLHVAVRAANSAALAAILSQLSQRMGATDKDAQRSATQYSCGSERGEDSETETAVEEQELVKLLHLRNAQGMTAQEVARARSQAKGCVTVLARFEANRTHNAATPFASNLVILMDSEQELRDVSSLRTPRSNSVADIASSAQSTPSKGDGRTSRRYARLVHGSSNHNGSWSAGVLERKTSRLGSKSSSMTGSDFASRRAKEVTQQQSRSSRGLSMMRNQVSAKALFSRVFTRSFHASAQRTDASASVLEGIDGGSLAADLSYRNSATASEGLMRTS